MSSKGWLIPEPIEGNEETCLSVTIPDNRRYVAAVVGAIYMTTKWFNWETTGNVGDTRATDTAAVMRRYIYDTLTVGDCPVELSEIEQERTQAVFSGFSAIDDLLDLLEQINVKYRIDGELYEPVIDLVKCGCGSGDGGGNASDGGGIVAGGSEGGNYDGLTRVIDICKNIRTIFLDQIDDWIDRAQAAQYVIGVNFISEGLEDLLGVSLQELAAFEVESNSGEFDEYFKKWVVEHFDDPFPGFIDRNQLRSLTTKLPIIRGGTLLMPVVRVWAETADIQELNAKIQNAKGTASLNGECAALQRGFGREPYEPIPGDTQSVIVIEDENYKYTRLVNTDIGPGLDETYDVSGAGFVGFIVRHEVFGGSGEVGTAALWGFTVDHTEGQTSISGSRGSGSTPGTGLFASGETNIGQTGAAAAPSYLSDFSSITNAKNPSGATFPAAGAFTGTFTFEGRFTYEQRAQVWIVTALSGSASLD